MTVSVTHRENIAIVSIDNPPVNAASHEVRRDLSAALLTTETDPAVAAVVLCCKGRTFMAGADIREFNQSPKPPALPDVLQQIEKAEKPWVAAIHGAALGAGCELALVCSARLATQDAKLGLPEVTLGLIPGAGGTVRLPRLVALDQALDIVVGGKPVKASRALKIGLIDEIVESIDAELLLDAAIHRAKGLATKGRVTPLSARPVLPLRDDADWGTLCARALKRTKGQNAPVAAIKALENARDLTFQNALETERAQFLALKQDPQSAALRHVFFAERKVGQSAALAKVNPRDLSSIGIVGGGTMGTGIATACLMAGFTVQLIEQDKPRSQAAARRVLDLLDQACTRGLLSKESHSEARDRFYSSYQMVDLGQSDLVIEAAFEDMAVKKEILSKLDHITKSKTILASNTSYLDLNDMAKHIRDPSRVVGLHFFAPAQIMKLLEIVRGNETAPEVLATALKFAKTLRKTPVISGVCDGFIANRVMSAYRREAEYMLEDGALPWQIDAAMRAFGMPMGVFEMQDLSGLDISWAMRKRRAATRPASERYVEIGDKLCEAGRFGRKSGRGYYLYLEGKPPKPDPEVEALILSEAARKGITRRTFKEADIMAHLLAAMQSEGREILHEGIATCEEDIDVAMINAYGFPRWRGGPMYMTHLP